MMDMNASMAMGVFAMYWSPKMKGATVKIPLPEGNGSFASLGLTPRLGPLTMVRALHNCGMMKKHRRLVGISRSVNKSLTKDLDSSESI